MEGERRLRVPSPRELPPLARGPEAPLLPVCVDFASFDNTHWADPPLLKKIKVCRRWGLLGVRRAGPILRNGPFLHPGTHCWLLLLHPRLLL